MFDFHPQITVIRGLPRAARTRVIETAEAIPSGMGAVSHSLIEAHGIRMDLSPENLELLDLNQRIDVVIAPSDLPTAAEPEPSMDAELTAARERAREADARYDQVLRSIAELRRQNEQLIEERLLLSRQIESARSNLDNFADAGLREAQDELATLERMAAGMRAEEADLSLRTEQARELEGRIEALNRELSGLLTADPTGVRTAFSALKVALEPLVLPSAEAQTIADGIATVQRRLALSPDAAAIEQRIEAAAQGRRQAGEAMLRAERESRSPALDPELVDLLEANRDELFALDRNRRAGPRGKRRLTQLREREHELLTQLGFSSWTAYLLGTPGQSAVSGAQDALNRARVAVARAEQEFHAAVAERTEHPALREMSEQLAAYVARGTALLGNDGGGDLIGALSRHTAVVEADPVAVNAAANTLLNELRAVGVTVDTGSVAVIETTARTWLESREDISARSAHLTAEIDALRQQRKALGAVNVRVAAAAGVRPDLALNPTRSEAMARVEEQAARLDRHRAAVAKLSELRAREELLTGHEQDIERKLTDSERMAGLAAEARQTSHQVLAKTENAMYERGSTVGQAPVEDPVAAVEWYVLARLAQQRAVSYAGSVPLIIDDAFEAWDFEDVERVHDRLERMSEAVQIVYFSESERVVDWAYSKGDRKAAVIDLASSASFGADVF